jgi:hypothetical protein
MSQSPTPQRQALAMPLAFALTLMSGSAVMAETRPDFSGSWKINKALSDDAKAKVAEAAGPDTVAGGDRTLGWNAFLPRDYGSGVERVNVREFLMKAVSLLEAFKIEQSATEVKTIHGDDESVRIFNLTRANSGSGGEGVKVTRKTHWQGEQLVLESESGEAKLTEVLTLVPARNQLIHALHYEVKVLKKPLDLKLVYDKVTGNP